MPLKTISWRLELQAGRNSE